MNKYDFKPQRNWFLVFILVLILSAVLLMGVVMFSGGAL